MNFTRFFSRNLDSCRTQWRIHRNTKRRITVGHSVKSITYKSDHLNPRIPWLPVSKEGRSTWGAASQNPSPGMDPSFRAITFAGCIMWKTLRTDTQRQQELPSVGVSAGPACSSAKEGWMPSLRTTLSSTLCKYFFVLHTIKLRFLPVSCCLTPSIPAIFGFIQSRLLTLSFNPHPTQGLGQCTLLCWGNYNIFFCSKVTLYQQPPHVSLKGGFR